MRYQVVCECGTVLAVSAGTAGTFIPCACGRAVAVPRLSRLRGDETTGLDRPAGPVEGAPAGEAGRPAALTRPAEVVGPTQVKLRRAGGRPWEHVVAAVEAGALWVQHTYRVQRLPLARRRVEARGNDCELIVAPGPDGGGDTITLAFADPTEGRRWHRLVAARATSPEAGPDDRYVPDGVAVVRTPPDVPYERLGRVECAAPSRWAAVRGLQLTAARRGADAVIHARDERDTGGFGARRAWGWAVRVEDPDARATLRRRWYAEEVRRLANRMLVLLLVQAALFVLFAVVPAGAAGLSPATGLTAGESLAEAGPWVALFLGWPVALVVLLRVAGRPYWLWPAGLGVLAATTAHGLAVLAAHLAAAAAAGPGAPRRGLWALVDPVDWAIILIGLSLFLRARRLATDATHMLPADAPAARPARHAWARGLVAVTGLYAVAFAGVAAVSRYQTSTELLRPGSDPQREHQALLALNQGVAQFDRGDLAGAEDSFHRSLRLWEELTARRPSPPTYRANLAITLYNLGLLRHRQGRADEAIGFYTRAAAAGDEVAGDPAAAAACREAVAEARAAAAGLRDFRDGQGLADKDRRAWDRYDAAVVQARKGDPAAATGYREAIAFWEEILPRATSPDYRRGVLPQLALAYIHLADLEDQGGKAGEAEAALVKAIDYGERAMAAGPDRPALVADNLEVARQMLDRLRERTHRDEFDRLCAAGRFGEAFEVASRGIAEQEARVRPGPDGSAAGLRAYRLNRFAWFLAHCPAETVRDPQAAVRHARRATDLRPAVGDYWFTLAVANYRNGDWAGCDTALAELKAREGAWDAGGWFLTAMNRHRQQRPAEARAALRNGVQWMDDRRRQAEDDAVLRFQFELRRPTLEALRREAERLLDNKDPGGDRVG